MARLLEILKSKAFRAGLLLVIFFAALGSGLAYLVRGRADRAQLAALESVVEGARIPVSTRFGLLEEDVRDAVRRVVTITSDVMEESEAAPAESGEPAEGEAAARESVLPLEERWRIRLAASLGELLESRSDTLDVTYLGRFSGLSSGSLMVARVERAKDGGAQPTQVDPRPQWDGAYLQEVISHEGESIVLSEPGFPTPEEGPAHALVRGAIPVRGSDGSVVGVVLISVDLTETLVALREALPAETNALLATAEGASLLHPVEDLALAKGQSAEKLLAASFPELDWSARNADEARNHGYVGSQRAERLLRFDAGQGEQAIPFTLAISAPIADVDLAAVLGPLFGSGAVIGGLGVVAFAGLAGFLWWRRRSAVDAEAEYEEPSELEARAEAIEADEADAAPEEAEEAAEASDDEAAPDDEEEDADDDDASAVDDDEEVGEPVDEASDDEAIDDEADEPEPLAAQADELPEDVAQCIEASDDAPSPAREEAGEPSSGLGAEPARELADIRSRLEDELEAARQRALDELAAARERFEAELASERERAIERLVAESRETLAQELGEEVEAAVAERRPTVETCEFDLRQLLGEVAAWLEGEAHGRPSQFGVRCSRQVPQRLLGDPEWVGPLLVHLARGALECSEDAPVELYVSCSDEGPAAVKLCFELMAPETGLYTDASGHVREAGAEGASLAEELVDAMHGDLALERSDDAGSCVRVVLPMSIPG